VEILDLISGVHLASFVIMLSRHFKCSTFSSCFIYHNLFCGWLSADSHYYDLSHFSHYI